MTCLMIWINQSERGCEEVEYDQAVIASEAKQSPRTDAGSDVF